MNNELELLNKAVQNLVQSDNNPDSDNFKAAQDYFGNYLTAKTNRKLNGQPDEK